jgi:hypothetical protein
MYDVNKNIDEIFKGFKVKGLLKEDETSNEEKTEETNLENSEEESNQEETINENSPGMLLKKIIEPEKNAIQLVLESINSSYINSYNGLRKYKPFDEQFKAWKKQVKGTCDSIMNKVKQNAFDPSDKTACSPMAYNVLADSSNRDIDMLELAGACIIFYNSLK